MLTGLKGWKAHAFAVPGCRSRRSRIATITDRAIEVEEVAISGWHSNTTVDPGLAGPAT